MAEVWTRWGIRKQLTAVAVVTVAVPLVLGILVLANLLTNSLSNAQLGDATDVANRTAAHVSEYGPNNLPGELQLEDGYRVQVLDAGGAIAWSSSMRASAPLSAKRPAPGETTVEGRVTWWGPEDRNEHRDLVVAEGVRHVDSSYVVLVATSQASQHDAVTVTVGLLFACVPLVMLAAGLVAWWVGGRALRPVDRMNEQVSRITSSTLDERVPLPPTQDEVRDLARTMNQMLERLEEAQNSQQRFVSDASHELRSPLASLTGALEIARQDDSLETWREMAELMADETARLNRLVQGLLTLSRRDDAGLKMHVTEVDLDDLVAEEVARLRSTGTVEVTSRITATRVDADADQLRQVLRNLADNAVRHARTTVRLQVQPLLPGGALVQVEDDGNGIAPADRGRVFERFVRLEESRSRDEGDRKSVG